MKKSRSVKRATLEIERRVQDQGYQHIAGVDEAGRGPLAGPVVVSAVILGEEWNESHLLKDSKCLSESERNRLFAIISKEALAFQIVIVPEQEIDQLNILQATLQGMAKAVTQLESKVDYVLVDGNQYPPLAIPGQAIVKGDQQSSSIAAASILAKVTRDRMMIELDQVFPEWRFAKHKGYATQEHRDAIKTYGLTKVHRRSFCKKYMTDDSTVQLSLL